MPESKLSRLFLIKEVSEKGVDDNLRLYQRIQDKTNNLILVISIYFPLLTLLYDKDNFKANFLLIIPLVSLLTGLIYIFRVYKPHRLIYKSVNDKNIKHYLSLNDEQILLHQIASNLKISELNREVIKKANIDFNKSFVFILMSLTISIILFIIKLVV